MVEGNVLSSQWDYITCLFDIAAKPGVCAFCHHMLLPFFMYKFLIMGGIHVCIWVVCIGFSKSMRDRKQEINLGYTSVT